MANGITTETTGCVASYKPGTRGGRLYRLNLAFSSLVDGQGRYVQDIVTQYATDISNYLAGSGLIMTCGSLAMGRAVEQALKGVLGEIWMNAAFDDFRYRQALY